MMTLPFARSALYGTACAVILVAGNGAAQADAIISGGMEPEDSPLNLGVYTSEEIPSVAIDFFWKNEGSSTLTFSDPPFTLSGPGAEHFEIIEPIDVSHVPPEGYFEWELRYAPSEYGIHQLSVTPNTNAINEALPFRVKAELVPSSGTLSIPETFNLGGILADGSPSIFRGLVVSNTGNGTLTFSDPPFTLGTSTGGTFTVHPENDFGPIAPYKDRIIYVQYTTDTVGSHSAALALHTSDPENPSQQVELTASGLSEIPVKLYDGQGPGISTIGPGGMYSTLSDVLVYNQSMLEGGDWTFLITGDIDDPGTPVIRHGSDVFGMVIKPAPDQSPTITLLNGTLYVDAPNVQIEGSNDSSNGRNLTILKLDNPDPFEVLLGVVSIQQETSRNFRLSSAIVESKVSGTREGGGDGPIGIIEIRFGRGNNTPLSYGNPPFPTNRFPRIPTLNYDIKVQNCLIVGTDSVRISGITSFDGRFAPNTLYEYGSSLAAINNEIIVTGTGIFLHSPADILLEKNQISSVSNSPDYKARGISIETHLVQPSTVNARIDIRNNHIRQVTAPSQNVAAELIGIDIDTSGNGHVYNIENNMITGIKLTGASNVSQRVGGIAVKRAVNHEVNIRHNSINVLQSDGTFASANPATVFGVGVTNLGFSGTVSLENNIIRNVQSGGTALYFARPVMPTTSNNNNLFSSTNTLVSRGGSGYATLAAWTTASGHDADSFSADPTQPDAPFTGTWILGDTVPGDLHFDHNPGTRYQKPALAGIDTDIDGEPRGATVVFIGADEPIDTDADGIAGAIEDGAPNNGDGNNDGIPDRDQPEVASLPNVVTGEYVTLEASSGVIVNPQSSEPEGDLPQEAVFPIGLLKFDVAGLSLGETITLTIFVEDTTGIESVYKYGVRPGETEPEWFDFSFDPITGLGAQVLSDRIVMTLKDGALGDSDLTENGVISDPIGPYTMITRAADWSVY